MVSVRLARHSRALVDGFAVVDPGQGAGQRRVGVHQRAHRLVDQGADRGAVHTLGPGRQEAPAGGRRYPEHAGAGVFVGVLQGVLDVVVAVAALGVQFGANLATALVEGVGDVLEEHQTQDHVLVVGRLQRAAQLVGRLPQGVLQLLHRGRTDGLSLGSGHGSPW